MNLLFTTIMEIVIFVRNHAQLLSFFIVEQKISSSMFKSCSHVHISLPSILFVDPIKPYFTNFCLLLKMIQKSLKSKINLSSNQVRIKIVIRPLLRLITLLYFLKQENTSHKKSGHSNKKYR